MGAVSSGTSEVESGKELRSSTTVNANGRVVIPSAMRAQMGIKPGDSVVLILEAGGVLRMISYRENIRRIQEEFRKEIPPGGMLMSDELIAERREEARREREEWIG